MRLTIGGSCRALAFSDFSLAALGEYLGAQLASRSVQSNGNFNVIINVVDFIGGFTGFLLAIGLACFGQAGEQGGEQRDHGWAGVAALLGWWVAM